MLAILGIASMLFVVWFTWHQYTSADPGVGAQTRRESLVEAWVNIVIGFSLNFIVNIPMIPLMADQAHHIPLMNNWWGGWVFTTISILRSYGIRRFCNGHLRAFISWMAGKLA